MTGDIRVIEMNPRVSRSSALASKATGYPIAKVAAKLAVGYTLDEIPNDLTGTTPASFEPTLDYVVVKIPRFAFEKFPGADTTLGTQMKSVGETMGIGRTFLEAFVKAKRGLEGDFDWQPENMHPWFQRELESLARRGGAPAVASRPSTAASTRAPARSRPRSNYFYATWGERDEAPPQATAKRVVILGSGPNRIGQGVEFDYCCVHAVQTFRALGYEAVMVNCNPETVSTDYDTSNRLYFEPLDAAVGARGLRARAARGRRDPVRRPDAAEARARDRGGGLPRSSARRSTRSTWPRTASGSATLLRELGVRCPEWGIARSRRGGGRRSRERIGYPVLVRPSYVLGGRAMRVCHDDEQVRRRVRRRARARRSSTGSSRTRSRSTSTRSATASDTYIGAVMQHVEEAGRPLRRLGLRAAGAVAQRADVRGDPRDRPPARSGARRRRAAERPARGRRRRGVRARGQSARVADRAVRVEGDRDQPRRSGLPARGR